MNKKWITIGVLGVVVLGGGYWAYKHFTAKPVTATSITDIAKLGDVRKVITATGTVNYPLTIPLSFPEGGKLVALNVNVGDVVKKGQVLAQLDLTNLQLAVTQSQTNLTSALARLQSLKDAFTEQSMAQAQASLARAQQALTTAQQNADPNYLANQVFLANQNVLLSSNSLAKAQQGGNSASIQSATSALTQAQTALTAAQSLQNGGAAAALTAAQADLAAAQAQVDQQNQGPKTGDLESVRAGIAQAQAALDMAKTNVADATLVAPADGLITVVTVQNYQNVGTSTVTPIMTMAPDQNNLQIDTAVDQADIGQVKVGQKADITLDSAPNQHISATVSRVAPQGNTVSNVTTFNVTLHLDSPSSLLHAAMSTNVSIILAEAKNVLTVPFEAIRGNGTHKGVLVPGTGPAGSTGTAGRSGGNAAMPANTHYVSVETGLDDGSNAEIKSGLTEGQEVVIGTRSSSAAKNTGTTGSGANPMRALSGGGGGRPGN
ncbi:MAG: HlyD family efflux transporter periplasmic adaptor subunit [Desulfitobacteriaceae bacterium]